MRTRRDRVVLGLACAALVALLRPEPAGADAASVGRVMAQFVISSIDLGGDFDLPLEPIPCTTTDTCISPGLMTIDTFPWTRVMIDGQASGSTPLFHKRLTPGMHQLEFVNEGEGIRIAQRFDVTGGKLMKVRGEFGTTANLRLGAIAPLQDIPESGLRDCGADLTSPGFLTVNTVPWSHVYVDGQPVGTTPLHRFRVAPGNHDVRMVIGATGAEFVTQVAVRKDEVVKITQPLP